MIHSNIDLTLTLICPTMAGSKLHFQYGVVVWEYAVLFRWHLLPIWLQPLALRHLSTVSCRHTCSQKRIHTFHRLQNRGRISVAHQLLHPMVQQCSVRNRPCCQSIAAKLLSKCASSSDRARLLASQSSGSGAWLEALPITSIGLKLDDTSLGIAASLRIGAPVVFAHTCVCGAPVERDGHHGLSCKRSVFVLFCAGRHMRHSNVNEIIQRAFHTAGIATIREPTGVFVDDRSADGITLLPQKKGKCLAWDFTTLRARTPWRHHTEIPPNVLQELLQCPRRQRNLRSTLT